MVNTLDFDSRFRGFKSLHPSSILKEGGLRLLVSEAAKKLGMNTQTLRLALQQNLFSFGVAVHTSENRYTYYINEARLEKYLQGKDLEVS